MFTFNGLGTNLYGKRDKDSDGWYTATKFFCILYFPIIPLGCYRVRRVGDISLSALLAGQVPYYEMYPIDENIAQARNIYLVTYGTALAVFILANVFLD